MDNRPIRQKSLVTEEDSGSSRCGQLEQWLRQ